MVAHLDGDDARATVLQRDAVGLFDEIGDRRSIVDCIDVLGCLAVRAGDHSGPLRWFALAERIRATTGLRRHRYLDVEAGPADRAARAALGPAATARVAAQASHLTVTEAIASPTRLAALTERETEVAGLVADGLTNRQIGPGSRSANAPPSGTWRTRAKLGLSGRTQVATWVSARGTPRSRTADRGQAPRSRDRHRGRTPRSPRPWWT